MSISEYSLPGEQLAFMFHTIFSLSNKDASDEVSDILGHAPLHLIRSDKYAAQERAEHWCIPVTSVSDQ